MPDVVFYLRQSDEEAVKRRLFIPDQQEPPLAKAKRRGVTCEEFADEGVSGGLLQGRAGIISLLDGTGIDFPSRFTHVTFNRGPRRRRCTMPWGCRLNIAWRQRPKSSRSVVRC